MNIGRSTTLFFDASVLVAGSHSSSGGSALLLSACRAHGFRAQVTSAVLLEAMHALEDFPAQSRGTFRRWLAEIAWELLPVPPAEVLHRYERYIAAKDAHVLAAAVEGASQFLLSLDRQHLLAAAPAVREMGLSLIILTPGEFIREYYPQHAEYTQLPPERR